MPSRARVTASWSKLTQEGPDQTNDDSHVFLGLVAGHGSDHSQQEQYAACEARPGAQRPISSAATSPTPHRKRRGRGANPSRVINAAGGETIERHTHVVMIRPGSPEQDSVTAINAPTTKTGRSAVPPTQPAPITRSSPWSTSLS